MKKHLALLLLLLTIGSCSESRNDCDNLVKIAENEYLLSEIRNWGKNIDIDNNIFTNSGKNSGTIFYKNIEKRMSISITKFGIPNNLLTFELLGEKIDYQNISMSDIEFVGIGYGYRSLLIVSIQGDNHLSIDGFKQFEDDFVEVKKGAFVLCR